MPDLLGNYQLPNVFRWIYTKRYWLWCLFGFYHGMHGLFINYYMYGL